MGSGKTVKPMQPDRVAMVSKEKESEVSKMARGSPPHAVFDHTAILLGVFSYGSDKIP